MGSKSKNSNLPEAEKLNEDSSINFFYGKGADTIVCLSDNKILKFNKGALCCTAGSEVLINTFYGQFQVKETEILDFDYDTFKLFLDSIMGYEEWSFDKAFKIFPVVHKYQCLRFIDKCINFLTPKKMDVTVSSLLNMAILYSPQSDKLRDNVVDFIFSNNVHQFLEDDNYCHLLEPDALKTILHRLTTQTVDSFLLMVLANWGKNYIQKNSLNFGTLKNFLQQLDLLNLFKLECFETTGAISEFCDADEFEDIFSKKDLLYHLNNAENLIHGKSKWKVMSKNQSITEEFIVSRFSYQNYNVDYCNSYEKSIMVKVERNKAVFYVQKPGKDSELQEIKRARTHPLHHNDPRTDEDFYAYRHTLLENEDEYLKTKVEDDEHYEDENKPLISCKITYFAKGSRHNRPTKKEDTLLFPDSNTEVAETSIVKPISENNCEPIRLRLTWTFSEDCRILLMKRPGNELNGPEGMYFTKKFAPYF